MSSAFDRRGLLKGAGFGVVMAVLAGEVEAAPSPATSSPSPGGSAQPKAGGGARAVAANQTITELVPGRLYRVGCVVKAERLSWLPQDLDGYEPVNAYLLRDDRNAVFFEMGLPISRPAIKQAVDTLIGDRKVYVDFSRNEADCIGNMGYILGTTRNPTFLYGTAGGVLEWINDPHVSELEVRDFLGRVPIEYARNGETKTIGELEMSFMDAGSKMMLMTQWMYERSTGCMFVSESFGWRHLKGVNDPVVITSGRGLPSVDTVARELVARMNWMREADYSAYVDRFEDIFRKHDVQMLAPVHGCVIKGREAVAAHVKLAAAAMRAAAKLPDIEVKRYV